MIDTNADAQLNAAVESELKNIRKVYGEQYHSLHEGYAILLEEVEETESELERVKEEMAELWICIKQNDNKGAAEALRRISAHSYFMLQECTQIGAVTKKFRGGTK
jgi:CII-binding regulator of phage lambda lysogenization HflD